MARLTRRFVEAAKPAGQPRVIWDDELSGFGLEVDPTGGKFFVLEYQGSDGQTQQAPLGRYGPVTPELARYKALGLLAARAEGHDPAEHAGPNTRAYTIAELAEIYLQEGPSEKPNKKSSSWRTDRSNVEWHILPLLGRIVANRLTRADVARFQVDVAAGKTAADIKTGPRGRAIVEGGRGIAARSVAVLGAMLNFAETRNLIHSNPVKGVKLFKKQSKERFLTEDELKILARTIERLERERVLPLEPAAVIKLLMLTGCRLGEVLSLKWQHVDFERRCLRLADSKTGAKAVPLAKPAVDLLRSLPKTKCWVFPARRGNVGHYVGIAPRWKSIKAEAQKAAEEMAECGGRSPNEVPHLLDLRLHDLRHSFASFAVQDGASLFLVGKVLGHKQTQTTEIYAHVAEGPLHATAEIAARRVASAFLKL